MSLDQIANTPEPPYYAAIFTSQRSDGDHGYSEMMARMEQLVAKQPGYLGAESARSGGLGITISYWSSLEAIAAWKANADHQAAQAGGKKAWYHRYRVRIAKVERDYGKEI